MLLPSTLSTTLGFLFFLSLKGGPFVNILSNEEKFRKRIFSTLKNKNILIRGILLSGITMTHPLYGLFYLIFYFLFEMYFFVVKLLREKTTLKRKIVNIGYFIFLLTSIFSVFLVMMLPFFIYYFFYSGLPFWVGYYYYFKPLYLFNPLTGIAIIGEFFLNLGVYLLTNTLIGDIENFLSGVFLGFISFGNLFHFNWIFGSGIIFIIIGILLPIKKFSQLNKKQRYLLAFIKFTFILTFLIYILNEIVIFTPSINGFLNVYLIRLIELFSGFWVIIFVYPFLLLIKLVKRLTNNISLRINSSNQKAFRNRKVKNITKRIISPILILSLIFFTGIYYILNYPRTSEWARYYFNDSHTDVVIFAGNYFNINPLYSEIRLLIEDQDEDYADYIYSLIQVQNLEKRHYLFNGNSSSFLNSTDYNEFKGDVDFMNVSYVLFNVKFTDAEFQSNLTSDFNIIYRNEDDWIFAKVK
jgi:hypothetical protein